MELEDVLWDIGESCNFFPISYMTIIEYFYVSHITCNWQNWSDYFFFFDTFEFWVWVLLENKQNAQNYNLRKTDH